MSRTLATLATVLALSACAARTPPRPPGTAGPDPSALEAFTRAQMLDARSFQLRIGEKPLSNEDRAQCHDSLAYRCMLAHPSRSWNMFVRRVSR